MHCNAKTAPGTNHSWLDVVVVVDVDVAVVAVVAAERQNPSTLTD